MVPPRTARKADTCARPREGTVAEPRVRPGRERRRPNRCGRDEAVEVPRRCSLAGCRRQPSARRTSRCAGIDSIIGPSTLRARHGGATRGRPRSGQVRRDIGRIAATPPVEAGVHEKRPRAENFSRTAPAGRRGGILHIARIEPGRADTSTDGRGRTAELKTLRPFQIPTSGRDGVSRRVGTDSPESPDSDGVRRCSPTRRAARGCMEGRGRLAGFPGDLGGAGATRWPRARRASRRRLDVTDVPVGTSRYAETGWRDRESMAASQWLPSN